jgi:superfamily II DNA/RNA helicase
MPYQSKTRSFGGRRNTNQRSSFPGGGRPGASRQRSSGRKGPKKDYIDPARFVKVAQAVEHEVYNAQHTFADFDLQPLLAANIAAKGFVTTSAIQDQSIPHIMDGKDLIGIADTGTGKTAAFGIPILNSLMLHDGKALIIAPTRELAQQIDAEFRTLAKGSGLSATVLIGGAGMGPQLRDLRNKPQIVIGTPGRIKDHMERGSLRLHDFSFAVLDEVDRMLDMGFINDVRSILNELPNDRQSLFFSATMDRAVSTLIQTFSHEPITVSVKTGETGENIHQDVVRVGGNGEKMSKLHDLLVDGTMTKTIIFDDTQRSVERLANELVARGFQADAIHGGKSQGQRQRSLKRFKDSEVNILVATDVAARGIDVVDISHVVNYSTPQSYSDYVHRIGRAGRAGRVGYALTFVER